MASYTTLDPTDLEAGAPITSAKMNVLYSNPEGIAEGVTGAPRVQPAAIQAPTAGDVVIRVLSTSGSVSGASTTDSYSYFILCDGQIRVRAEHKAGLLTSSTLTIKHEVGATVTDVFTQTVDAGGDWQTGTVDVTVKPNDRILVYFDRNNTVNETLYRDVEIRGNSRNFLTGV